MVNFGFRAQKPSDGNCDDPVVNCSSLYKEQNKHYNSHNTALSFVQTIMEHLEQVTIPYHIIYCKLIVTLPGPLLLAVRTCGSPEPRYHSLKVGIIALYC